MLGVKRAEPRYASAVIILLTRLKSTPSGADLVERLSVAGQAIIICQPDAVNPPNAWVLKNNERALSTLPPDANLIYFDPQDWPSPLDPSDKSVDLMLYKLLLQAESLPSADISNAPLHPTIVTELERYQSQRSAQRI